MASKNIRYKSDGSKYYYYYKKKRGKKKKRGRKKTKTEKSAVDRSWNYKILKFEGRKQCGYIGKYRKYGDAYKKMQELLSENLKVDIPVQYKNNSKERGRLNRFLCEYAIMKKIKEEGESNESLVRNIYGKFVKHVATSEKYYLLEKYPCLIEEKFWVYGYNPRTERKDFKWICENIVDGMEGIVNIYIYNNKLIIRHDNGFEFVICKNMSDTIRLYNKLSKAYEKNKFVVFTGSVSGHTDRSASTISMIREKTGWPLMKIYRKTTAI